MTADRFRRYIAAMQSISMSNGPIDSGTQSKMRAGGSTGKQFAQSRVDGREMPGRGGIMAQTPQDISSFGGINWLS
jgi:ribosomal protein L3